MFNKNYRKQISEKGPVCPYCGYHDLEFIDINDCVDGEEDIYGCHECGQNYEYGIIITHRFTTKKVEEIE